MDHLQRSLEIAYGGPSESRIIQLQMQFHNLHKGNSDISVFLRRAKLLVDELATARSPIHMHF